MNEEIITSIKNEVYEYIHTNIPATVESFDPVSMTATVKILAKFKIRGIEQVPKNIYRVPVGHNRSEVFAERTPLKKGDIVLLSFSEFSLEKILSTGKPESVLGSSKFDLTDAIITTCISGDRGKLPKEHSNDWVLFNLETGHEIIFRENGVYEIKAKKMIMNIDDEIEINTPTINALKSHLNVKSIKATSIITDTLEAVKSAVIVAIDFITHKHGGVQGGKDKTGGAE